MTPPTRWLLPLTRRNAVAAFARGLVLPRLAIDRYRPDLLELTPTHLPLFADAVSAAVMDLCARQGDDFPVLLEIAPDDLAVSDPVLRDAGETLAAAPAIALPTTRVSAVLVRSESELQEISTRAYTNVDGADLPLRVDGDAFAGRVDVGEGVLSWFRNLPAAELRVEELAARDAVAGALYVLVSALPGRRALVHSTVMAVNSVLEVAPHSRAVQALVDALEAAGTTTSTEDKELLQAICERLAETSGTVSPTKVVTSVSETLSSSDNVTEIHRNLERVLALTMGEEQLTAFRPGGLRSAKALLLYLLRSDPADIPSWQGDPVGAEPEVLLLAAALSGLAKRASSLSSQLRAPSALQDVLTSWVAEGLAALPTTTHTGRRLTSSDADDVVTIAIGGTVLRQVTVEDGILALFTTSDEFPVELAVSYAKALGWMDVLLTIVEAPAATVTKGRQGVRVELAGVADIRFEVTKESFLQRLAATDAEKLVAARQWIEQQHGSRSGSRTRKKRATSRQRHPGN